MASLGFRPPHFSEDLAWCPAWLQPCPGGLLDDSNRELQIHSEQSIKDLAFLRENIGEPKDVIFSSDDGRYNSCHLFLSGEDNSPSSFAPSHQNALHFHLHLSSDLDSTCDGSKHFSATELQFESTRMQSAQVVETTAENGNKKYQSNMDCNTDGINLFSLTSSKKATENVIPQSLIGEKGGERPHEETFKTKFLGDAAISDAVELSIAASEALVIHELVQCQSALDVFPIEAVLEVSLQLKQARLEGQQNSPLDLDDVTMADAFEDVGLSFNVTDDFHPLDLDDVTMADAFEDVGLSFNVTDDFHPCDSDTSLVNDSLKLKYQRSEDVSKHSESISKQAGFEGTYMNNQLEDIAVVDLQFSRESPLRLPNCEEQKKGSGNLALNFDPTMVNHVDPMLLQNTQENSNVLETVQNYGPIVMDTYSSQPELDLNSSSLSWSSKKSQVEGKDYTSPASFASRWFGGWAMKVVDFPSQKEVNASPASPKRIKESVPKYFIDETSFLSESADVAPDANSVVLKSEIISKMVSQSSICFDGLPERNVGSVMTSQDIVMSCSQLFADPLCSVVPCSISSENASPLDLQNRTGREDDSRRCCISTPEPGVQALQDTSYLNVGNDQGNGQEMNVVRRQLTSFKTYSTPLSDLNFCNQFPSEGHRGLLSGEHNISGIAYPHKRSSIGSIPFRYETQVVARDDEKNHENVDLTETEFVVRGDGKNHKIVMTENPILEKVNDERNCEELRTDPAELVMQALKERKFPFVVKDDEKNRENVDLTETDFVVRDDEKNHGTRMTENPILEKESQKRNHEEIRKDQAELVIQALRERKFPLVLNHRRRRVQASKHQVDELNQERNHKQDPEPEDKVKLQNGKSRDTVAPGKKRVHFVEDEVQPKQDQDIQKLQSSHGNRLASRASKRIKYSNPLSVTRAQDAIRFLQTRTKNRKRLMFQNIEFLLTGISSQQEKEIKGLIRKYGGTIHPNIPPPPSPRKKTSNFLHIPIVLCLKKVQTTKFLFGCAVNAFILNVNWLTDSIAAGSILPPEKYMILSNHGDGNGAKIGLSAHHCNTKCIFARVGIMLQGKQNFCTKLEKIIKHGGGLVFKTLQLLIQSLDTKKISVGAIVAENKCQVSRHLRHCGSERKIAIMSGSWVIKSLHSGELIPFTSNMSAPTRRIVFPKLHISAEWSEEI